MIFQKETITKGFFIAGLMNMSVLVFSKLFTNPVIPKYDPVVMSNFGLLMIVVWGLAYMSVAKNYHHVRWLVGVFAIEKFIYGFIWIQWLMKNNISTVFAEDKMSGTYFAIYGVNDWVFCIFFLFVFVQLSKSKIDGIASN